MRFTWSGPAGEGSPINISNLYTCTFIWNLFIFSFLCAIINRISEFLLLSWTCVPVWSILGVEFHSSFGLVVGIQPQGSNSSPTSINPSLSFHHRIADRSAGTTFSISQVTCIEEIDWKLFYTDPMSKWKTLPAGLSVLQTAVPLTSASLPDHTSCNEDSCEAEGSEAFPASPHHIKHLIDLSTKSTLSITNIKPILL